MLTQPEVIALPISSLTISAEVWELKPNPNPSVWWRTARLYCGGFPSTDM